MGVVLGEGIIRLVADAAGIARGLKDAKTKADRIAKTTGKAGAVLSASVTAPILGFFGMAVDAASDLNEAANKLDVTFGQYGQTVRQALGDTVQKFGMSRDAAYEAAATYGIFLKAAGLTNKQLAEMSPQLIQVAADMASFHNIPIDQALYKVRAALSGETEPLKSVGILMNDAMVKAQALQMGLVKASVDMVKVKQITLRMKEAQDKYNAAVKKYGADSTQAQKALLRYQALEQSLNKAMAGKVPQLTEAQKIQARYALLMQQSAVFAGDFQRTQNGVANSSRMVKEALRDTAAEFGKELLPVARDFLQAALRLLRWFRSLPEPVKRGAVEMLALAAAIGPVLLGVSSFIRVAQGINTAIGWLGKIGSIAGMVQTAATAIIGFLGPVGIAILAVIAIAALLYTAWTHDWGGIREKTAAVVAWLKTAFRRVGDIIRRLVSVAGVVMARFAQVIQTAALAPVNFMINYWTGLIARARQIFTSVVNGIRSAFHLDWGSIGRAIVNGIIGGITSMGAALWNAVKGAASSALDAAKGVLGIHSPSRKFHKFGVQTIEGYIRGVTMGGKRLHDAISRTFTPPAQPTLAGVGAGASGGSRGNAPVYITIHNPTPEAAEDSVARAMKRLAYLGKVR